ncbi:hypothetical protein IAI10_20515 [Clostridium sp. 19966]|uniref:hypothetical protein n=1 Tax=Clostridium sp. 19966 TaxID=2768166 RepID=UPI0028E061A6|nr:hypothetical protein [Clostridium sp. 19966]MDT8719036.1 hypothetical protein [Clostridium sp. 19966]
MKYSKQVVISILIIAILTIITITYLKNIDTAKVDASVISTSESYIIIKDLNHNEKFIINNSKSLELVDKNNNIKLWDEIKGSTVIKVYYSGPIKETSPAVFTKVVKIVIIS